MFYNIKKYAFETLFSRKSVYVRMNITNILHNFVADQLPEIC